MNCFKNDKFKNPLCIRPEKDDTPKLQMTYAELAKKCLYC